MERQVLTSGLEGIVLRYGFLCGPGTWYDENAPKPSLHVDAAAQAAVLALGRGAPGIYNIANDDGVVSIDKCPPRARLRPGFQIVCLIFSQFVIAMSICDVAIQLRAARWIASLRSQ